MGPEQVFAHDQGAVTRAVAGEMVIVPLRDQVASLSAIYTLNETGTFLWERIDGARTVRELIQAVVEAFDVSPAEAAGDVIHLLDDLRAEGLLREVVSPAGTPAASL